MKIVLVLVLILSGTCIYAQTTLQSSKGKALINGTVVNDKNIPIENEEVVFLSIKNKKSYTGISDKSGKFQISVPVGDKYKVQYQSITTTEDYKEIDIPNAEGVTVDFKLEITPETIITLKNVFFESAKSALKPESFVELDKLYKFMSLKKTVVIEISGHTDNVGNKDSNQKLSEDRANSVKNYLVKKGIAAARIEIKGYGDSLPVADNSSEEGRKLNRRTVVKILKQ
jgi:outer membrane protein OmpA-like peptidoglycan-associated protein